MLVIFCEKSIFWQKAVNSEVHVYAIESTWPASLSLECKKN